MIRKLILLAAGAMVSPSFASFQADFSGARAAALGGSSAVVGEGAREFFGSPAALASASSTEVSLTYADPFTDTGGGSGMGSLALAVPGKYGAWGAGLTTYRAAGAMEETSLSAGIGGSLLNGTLQLGGAVKRLEVGYNIGNDSLAQGDPVFSGGTRRVAFDADVAATARVGGLVRGGIAVQNLRRADLGLAGENRLRRRVTFGAALDIPALGMVATGNLAAKSGGPSLGVEKTFNASSLALRAGVNRDVVSTGFGLSKGPISLDYAFLTPRNSGANAVSHQAQLTYRFARQER